MNRPVIPSVELQIPMPNTWSSADLANVQDIQVEWDPKTGGVIVTPNAVKKGTVVRFKNPKGDKVRIVFLSPSGGEAESVLDTELITMTTGGVFHFECFFTAPGATKETKTMIGGVLDVSPHLP